MSKKAIIGAVLTGAAAGVASLLFAPKKGSELREDAKAKLVVAKEKAQAVIEKYRNTEKPTEENTIVVQDVVSETVEAKAEETVAETPAK